MSAGHWHDNHGHGDWGGGSNALGECFLWYTKEVSWAAHGIAGAIYTAFLWIFDSGWGGWHHDHGHH